MAWLPAYGHGAKVGALAPSSVHRLQIGTSRCYLQQGGTPAHALVEGENWPEEGMGIKACCWEVAIDPWELKGKRERDGEKG